MLSLKIGKIHWLIKSNKDESQALAIYRTRKGYFIYKGTEVIHSAKGIEGWHNKWYELEAQGYVTEDRARLYDLLPSDWNIQRLNMTYLVKK